MPRAMARVALGPSPPLNRLSASHRYLGLLTPLAMRSLMMEVDEYYA
jgi:hypothetical protein